MAQLMYNFYTSKVVTYNVQLRGNSRAPWSINQVLNFEGISLDDFAEDRELLGQSLVYMLEDIAMVLQPLHHPITEATTDYERRKWLKSAASGSAASDRTIVRSAKNSQSKY